MVDAAAAGRAPRQREVVVVTGMSGAGRTRAAGVLADHGWYVVDNLPPAMIVPLVDMMTHSGTTIDQIAAVVDARGGAFFDDILDVLEHLRAAGVSYRVLFLDASDEALVRRFEQVRRPHPLQGEGGILDGLAAERRLLGGIQQRADVVIDTSTLTVHELARQVRAAVQGTGIGTVRIHLVAFGFKYGLPLDADHVVDVRFLPNPFWVDELRHLTGRDEPVRAYVLGRPGAREFLDRYVRMLEPVLEGYRHEEKGYVTVAVGCTGGQHRSVAMAEELARLLRAQGRQVAVTARDLGKE